jgi:hypothetical protein
MGDRKREQEEDKPDSFTHGTKTVDRMLGPSNNPYRSLAQWYPMIGKASAYRVAAQ